MILVPLASWQHELQLSYIHYGVNRLRTLRKKLIFDIHTIFGEYLSRQVLQQKFFSKFFYRKEYIPPFFASRNRLRGFPKRENASLTIKTCKKWFLSKNWHFGLKKLVYFDFLVDDSTKKVVSSYAQHFPTLLESRFEKNFGRGRLGPRGSKIFFKFWFKGIPPC